MTTFAAEAGHLERPSTLSSALGRPNVLFAALQYLVLVAFALQFVIDPTYENLLASAIVFCSSTLCIQYLRLSRAFPALPMSSFAILGLCITTQWGALVAQSGAWTALTLNLRAPLSTFSHLAEYQAVAILTHWLYSRWRLAQSVRAGTAVLAARIGLFETPSVISLWAMGFIGLVAQYLCGSESDAVLSLGLLTKIAQGFTFLAWAPFLLPVFHRRFGSAYCRARPQYLGLAAYVMLAIALGMALNFRGVMFFGIVTGLLLLGLTTFIDDGHFRRRQIAFIALAITMAGVAVAYAADLATAMAVARSQRGQISALEMIEETIYVLGDPYVVQRYRDAEEEATRGQTYDEYYFGNSVVGRLVETKFHDNMFFLTEGLPADQLKMVAQQTVERLWEIFPRPVLGVLGINLEPEKISETSSMGDYFVFLKYGGELGGFKTGSMFAHGAALFPITFPLWYALICTVLFWQWDALTRRDGRGRVELSALAMLLVLRCFMYGITTESISGTVSYMLRTYWQNIIIYLLVFRVLEFAARGLAGTPTTVGSGPTGGQEAR